MIDDLFILATIQTVIDSIGGMFMGIFGSELYLGIFIFLFLMIFTLVLGLGMLVGSVVLIPGLFLVFKYIPSGRIILAIVLGLFVGIGLNQLIRR